MSVRGIVSFIIDSIETLFCFVWIKDGHKLKSSCIYYTGQYFCMTSCPNKNYFSFFH